MSGNVRRQFRDLDSNLLLSGELAVAPLDLPVEHGSKRNIGFETERCRLTPDLCHWALILVVPAFIFRNGRCRCCLRLFEARYSSSFRKTLNPAAKYCE